MGVNRSSKSGALLGMLGTNAAVMCDDVMILAPILQSFEAASKQPSLATGDDLR